MIKSMKSDKGDEKNLLYSERSNHSSLEEESERISKSNRENGISW